MTNNRLADGRYRPTASTAAVAIDPRQMLQRMALNLLAAAAITTIFAVKAGEVRARILAEQPPVADLAQLAPAP